MTRLLDSAKAIEESSNINSRISVFENHAVQSRDMSMVLLLSKSTDNGQLPGMLQRTLAGTVAY